MRFNYDDTYFEPKTNYETWPFYVQFLNNNSISQRRTNSMLCFEMAENNFRFIGIFLWVSSKWYVDECASIWERVLKKWVSLWIVNKHVEMWWCKIRMEILYSRPINSIILSFQPERKCMSMCLGHIRIESVFRSQQHRRNTHQTLFNCHKSWAHHLDAAMFVALKIYTTCHLWCFAWLITLSQSWIFNGWRCRLFSLESRAYVIYLSIGDDHFLYEFCLFCHFHGA